MKLTETQVKQLQNIDFVEATRKARKENTRLMNDQGFVALSLAISNAFALVVENPDVIIKELKP